MNTANTSQLSASPGSALAAQRGLIVMTLVFGSFVNLLVLTGPIFALQVYDRVLGSRSIETLVALSLLMAFLFLVMGILDHARKRIASRIGERLVSEMEPLVFQLQPAGGNSVSNDLETLRQFLASPLFIALLDLIWLPLFVIALAILHPALGWFCLAGGTFFLIPGIWNLLVQNSPRPADHSDFRKAGNLVDTAMSGVEFTQTIDPNHGIFRYWQNLRARACDTALKAQDQRAVMASASQTFRMFFQSAAIAFGAYLVLLGELTPGAIIAATVLLARAIAPLDMVSQNTPTLRALAGAWRRLSEQSVHHTKQTPAPIPGEPGLLVDQLTVFTPGRRRAALRMISFVLPPASAIGILGMSDSGKSTLARAIAGIWPAAGGILHYGKAGLSGISATSFEQNVGYLPQFPIFLPGSIRQNISGFENPEDEQACVAAAVLTGAHDLILALPDGYETLIGPMQTPFSSGLLQRIALARAVFHNPPLLVLDEPMNNLDQDGIDTVNELILSAKSAGRCAVVLSQKQAALIGCDQILTLDNGIQKSLGPSGKSQPLPKPKAQLPISQISL